VPNEVKQPYGHEEVSEITGTAIPAYLEFIIRGTCKIYEECAGENYFSNLNSVASDDDHNEPHSSDDDNNFNDVESKILVNMPLNETDDVCIDDDTDAVNVDMDTVDIEPVNIKPADMKIFYDCFKIRESFYAMLASDDLLKPNKLLYLATRYCSYRSGYKFKNVQIKYHTWLSLKNFDKCNLRCKSLNISSRSQFESLFECKIKVPRHDQVAEYEISGCADCIDGNNFYEFKCVKELKPEHFLQLAIYMYMHQASKIDVYCMSNKLTCHLDNVPIEILTKYHYYLYNILTDEMVEIKCSFKDLQDIVITLINEKNKEYPKCTDDEFIHRGLQIASKY
jgi:hypothetical protein